MELGEAMLGMCNSLIDWEIPAHIKKLTGGPYYRSNVSNPRLNENTRLEYVGDYAFNSISGMTSVDISSATYVGEAVFAACSDLQHVVLPSNMTEIPRAMFSNCPLLQSVELPAGVKTIIGDAFNGCSSLTDIDLSEVELIGGCAFNDCIILKSVDLSHCVEIGIECFANCASLESVRLLTAGELKIGDCAFYGCQALKSITIPAGVTKFSESHNCGFGSQFNGGIFAGTSAAIVFEPDSQLRVLGDGAFSGANFTEITLPNVAEFMRDCGGIFANCPNLRRVSFPALISCTIWDSGCFQDCPSLEEIDMPKIQDIVINCFNLITSPNFKAVLPETLKTVYYLDLFEPQFDELICNAAVPPTVENRYGSGSEKTINCTLRVPAASIDAYKADPGWSKFAEILPIE